MSQVLRASSATIRFRGLHVETLEHRRLLTAAHTTTDSDEATSCVRRLDPAPALAVELSEPEQLTIAGQLTAGATLTDSFHESILETVPPDDSVGITCILPSVQADGSVSGLEGQDSSSPLPWPVPLDDGVEPLVGCPGLDADFCLPADVDLDFHVDFRDFLILSENFGLTGATRRDGDLDGDGQVGFGDFLILTRHFEREVF